MLAKIDFIWAMLVVCGLLIIVASAVGRLTATLREESSWTRASESTLIELPPPISGTLIRDGDDWTLELAGGADSEWLVVQPDGAARAVRLDRRGRAELHGVDRRDDFELRVVYVPSSALVLRAPAATVVSPTPSPTRSPKDSRKPPPTPSPTPTPTPTPSPDPKRGIPAVGTRGARPKLPSPPILHLVPDAGARIALTFDGGMSSNGTLDFLDFLSRNHLQVTLFLTGQFIEREPGLVRRVVLAGHEVGNHTFTHLHLTSYGADHRHRLLPDIDEAGFKRELRRTEEAFFAATGRRLAPLWRSPYGEENRTLRAWALELGYLHVRWSSLRGASLDSRDWVADEHSTMYEEPRRMMERLMSFPHLEGGIVLMHLSSDRIEPPWTELPIFLTSLKKRGIEPVKVTELLAASRTWRGWLEKARAQHLTTWGEDAMVDD